MASRLFFFSAPNRTDVLTESNNTFEVQGYSLISDVYGFCRSLISYMGGLHDMRVIRESKDGLCFLRLSFVYWFSNSCGMPLI